MLDSALYPVLALDTLKLMVPAVAKLGAFPLWCMTAGFAGLAGVKATGPAITVQRPEPHPVPRAGRRMHTADGHRKSPLGGAAEQQHGRFRWLPLQSPLLELQRRAPGVRASAFSRHRIRRRKLGNDDVRGVVDLYPIRTWWQGQACLASSAAPGRPPAQPDPRPLPIL